MTTPRLALPLLTVLVVALVPTPAFTQAPTPQPVGPLVVNPSILRPWGGHSGRKVPFVVANLDFALKNRIDIKFRAGSGVRSRGGAFVIVGGKVTGANRAPELAQVNAVLATARKVVVVRMHTLPELELEAQKTRGEAATRDELPDLNLWFHVYVDVATDADVVALLNRLNAIDVVEIAKPSPLPAPPPSTDERLRIAFGKMLPKLARPEVPTAAEVARIEKGWLPERLTTPLKLVRGTKPLALRGHATSPTPDAPPPAPIPPPAPPAQPLPLTAPGDMTAKQTYTQPAPLGIDADYVKNFYWAATGAGWGYTDVEFAWNRAHKDLTKIAGPEVLVNGLPSGAVMADPHFREHGTAVVGEISSDDDGIGTTGLAPDALVRLSSESVTGRPAAISAAASQFWRGTVILLEMQMGAGFDCNGDHVVAPLDSAAADLVPAEHDPAVKDAIKHATGNGIIVVEAAGNGNCDLDRPEFKGEFAMYDLAVPEDPVNQRDSGAIIVGASERDARHKAFFSTFGKRVDVNAEGDFKIFTTGFGTKRQPGGPNDFVDPKNPADNNHWYTDGFSGTSGASPIVTGGTLILAGTLFGYYGSIYAPKEIRDVLRRDGSPQAFQPGATSTVNGLVGTRPDLKKAIEHGFNRHLAAKSSDFDGDGKADLATWSPASGMWTIRKSTGGTQSAQLGKKGDVPCPADMIGDGATDLVVFRPITGEWLIRDLKTNATKIVQWGTVGDIPIPLDFDGDGKADPAVFRSVDAVDAPVQWLVTAGGKTFVIAFGQSGDIPLAADFDGDKKDDLVTYRRGQWDVRLSKTPGLGKQFVLGDFRHVPMIRKLGGGALGLSAWDPADGTWLEHNPQFNVQMRIQFGVPGDVPRFADTDGNGIDERIVFRPSSNVFFDAETGLRVPVGFLGDFALAR